MTQRSSKQTFLAAVALLACWALPSGTAQAQFLPRGMRFPTELQSIIVLRNESVQKELALTQPQMDTVDMVVNEMISEAMAIFGGLQDLTPAEAEKETPNLMKMLGDKGKELQAKVDKSLDEKQSKRYRQLSIQQRGVAALEDEAVIKELKITEEQVKKLAEIREEASAKQQELVQELMSGGDQAALRTKIEGLQGEVTTKALAVLTQEQRDGFEKLKGEKFQFPAARGFGF